MDPVTLRTARLELSPPTRDDIDAIHDACQDADIQRYTTVPSPYTRDDAESFIDRVAEQWQEGVHLTWGIHQDGLLVGTVGLYRMDRAGTGAAEIGYWVAPGARGHGVLSEAANAVLDWGFSAAGPDLARVEWRAVVGNVASARGARSVGFRYEGTLRQAIRNGSGVRSDAWIGGILPADPRTPVRWPVLG
ncbi:GNAT family N-acetyltransferase [Microbacterium caowuchunii]|uniref:GNAT family N-acetyltransferase n=1 Tax=Microbacterium caowuchunii TaxID=2614638 RepID=UPI00124428EF|nr:GNAT family N-acetyltransferase [Microbacterium caowuchunii]QEW00689.1 GNAT family N-acetyltransferase [Microbacterium caowuchunii]